MPDYKTMYYSLAANVADAIETLIAAMQSSELQYMHDMGSHTAIPHDMANEENAKE